MLSWSGSDDAKHEKNGTRLRGENMFIIFSAAKMLGSHWLVYVLLRTQKHQMMVHAQTTALGMKLHFTCRKSSSRMEWYTNAELADMHLAYEAALCNGRATQRLYAQRNPRRVTSSHTYFARFHQQTSDIESFIVNTQARERTVRTLENEENVLDVLQNNPSTSTRAIASHVGISHSSV